MKINLNKEEQKTLLNADKIDFNLESLSENVSFISKQKVEKLLTKFGTQNYNLGILHGISIGMLIIIVLDIIFK